MPKPAITRVLVPLASLAMRRPGTTRTFMIVVSVGVALVFGDTVWPKKH